MLSYIFVGTTKGKLHCCWRLLNKKISCEKAGDLCRKVGALSGLLTGLARDQRILCGENIIVSGCLENRVSVGCVNEW